MSSEKKNFELDRRSLLKNILVGTGLGTSGVMNTFLTNMMINFMEKGTAQAAGVDPAFEDFKFISLVMSGGLPRYYWDLPLNPNGNDDFVVNPMVVTKFNPDGSSTYGTTKVGNYYLPHVWNSKIPTTGGMAPMKDLAKHMMIMRGIDLQIDSHDIDRYRQIAPVPGGISLSGLIADAANTPIPAVGRNGGGGFYQGEKGIAYLELSGTNPLTSAISPFTPFSSMLSLNSGAVEGAIDQALLRMQASATNKGKYIPSTFASRFNAKKMMMKQFGDLQSQFNSLVMKYRGLITRSFGPTAELKLAGVEDMSLAGNGGAKHRLSENEYFTGADILTITDTNTLIAELAEGMAIAEYMIINGLSSSVNIQSGNITNFLVQEAYNPTTKMVTRTNGRITQSTDVHFTGADIGVVLFTRYYRAVSACLNELISRLKETKTAGGNLFDRTAIAVTSDFNRLPRLDGSGADHGWEGSCYTLFTGMIDELKVVGNVRKTDSANRGTWGLAGGLSEIGGREAIIGNVASTVSNILELKTPTPNDTSFSAKENGKVKMVIKSVKNVA